MYWPTTHSLALSENLLGLSLLLWPVDAWFDDTLLLVNLAIVLSFFSLALVAFGVFRAWTGSWWLAMIAGLAIGFAPPRISQLDHMQLLSYQPMLLCLFFADRWTRRLRGSDAAGLFACLALQLLFGIYLFVFTLVFLSLFLLCLVALRIRRGAWIRFTGQAAAGAAVLAAVALPIYLPYRHVRDDLGIRVSLSELMDLGADVTDFLRFPGSSWLHGDWSWRFVNPYTPYPWEHEVALPFVLVALLAFSLVAGARLLRPSLRVSEPTAGIFLASLPATAMCVALMFGPRLHLFGEAFDRVPMPYALYHALFPGFEGLRVPARFIFPASVGCVVLALLPLAWLRHRHQGSRALALAFPAIFVVLLAESWTRPLQLQPVRPRDALPEFVEVLKRRPPAPIFVWPATLSGETEYLYLYYQTYHWNPMVNGRSGYLPPDQGRLLRALIDEFPSHEALARLRAIGVRTLVIQGEWIEGEGARAALAAALADLRDSGEIAPIYQGAVDSVWALDGP
jgi:hypothetical protein